MIVQSRERWGRTPRARNSLLFGAGATTGSGSFPGWTPAAFGSALKVWCRQGTGLTLSGFPQKVSAWLNPYGVNLTQSTGGVQSIYYSFSGTNYCVLPAINGNSPTSADSVPLGITSDASLVWWGALDDWTNFPQNFISKWNNAGQSNSSYLLATDASTPSRIRFAISSDGSYHADSDVSSSTSYSFAAGQLAGVAVYWNAATKTATFYTSTDFVTWTQLGTPQTTAAGSIAVKTAPVFVGGIQANGNSEKASGKAYRAQIWSGNFQSGGTKVWDANFSAQPAGTTSFTESSANAATVTINQSGGIPAQIIGSNVLLFDGGSFFEQMVDASIVQPVTWFMPIKFINRVASRYLMDGASADTGVVELDAAAANMDIYAGSVTGTQAGPAVNSWKTMAVCFDGANSFLQFTGSAAVTGDAGASNMGGFTLGASASGTNAANFMTTEVVGVLKRATAAEVSLMQQYFGV